MKATVTIDLEIPRLGEDERYSARFIAGDAFRLAVEKLRSFGVASVTFSRNVVSITLGHVQSPLEFRAALVAATAVESDLVRAFDLVRRSVQEEIPTDPRLPVIDDPASSP